MKRLFIQSCLAPLCASSVVFAYEPPASRRTKYNFNSGWKLFVGDPAEAEAPGFDDSAWKEVTLPRAWNEDDASRKDIKDLSCRHENGVTAFGFDVTDHLLPTPQENVVAARRQRLEL